MSDSLPQFRQIYPDEVTFIYTRLHPQEVEQFYVGYHQWVNSQQIMRLQTEIERIQQQITENYEIMRQMQPSPIALATLARLQSNGVYNVYLLDRMLSRGENWLDLAMQHLNYCEEIDAIQGNYTDWCEHALEGAYDWIDSMQHAASATSDEAVQATNKDTADRQESIPLDETTEETLLQKLMSDEPEDAEFLLATTLKRPTVSPVKEVVLVENNDAAAILPIADAATASAEPLILKEGISTAVTDIAESSPVSKTPAAELMQTEPPSANEEMPAADASASAVTSQASVDQLTPSEQIEIEHVAPEAEVEEQDQEPKVIEAQDTRKKPAYQEQDSIAEDGHSSSHVETLNTLPQPVAANTHRQEEKPVHSEANASTSDIDTLVDVPTSNSVRIVKTKPSRKRGFLQWIFSFFFRRRNS